MNLSIVRVLWSSLFFSTFLELAVVLWGDFDRHVDVDLAVTAGLAVVATTVAAASFLVPSRIHSAALRRLALPVVEVPLQTSASR